MLPDRKVPGRYKSLGNAEAFGDRVPSATEDAPPTFATTGKWRDGAVVARVLHEETVRVAGDGRGVVVMVLDRALVASPAVAPVATRSSLATFGSRKHETIHDAMDYLFAVDCTGDLQAALNTEVMRFRNDYTVVAGYEEQLFRSVLALVDAQVALWVEALGHVTVSRRRLRFSTTLAVHCYIHSQLYQTLFAAVCTACAEVQAEFDHGVQLIANSGQGLVDFGIDQQLADSIDLQPLAACIEMLNVATNPFDKLSYVELVFEAVEACVTAAAKASAIAAPQAVTVDVMFPLLAFSFARFHTRNLFSHFEYTQKFLPEGLLSGSEREYNMVTFEAIITYIREFKSSPQRSHLASRVSLDRLDEAAGPPAAAQAEAAPERGAEEGGDAQAAEAAATAAE
jgi:hypothetical protein